MSDMEDIMKHYVGSSDLDLADRVRLLEKSLHEAVVRIEDLEQSRVAMLSQIKTLQEDNKMLAQGYVWGQECWIRR